LVRRVYGAHTEDLISANNTDFGDDLYWNHTITLPLDEKHDIIFAILDWYGSNEHLKDEMKTIIEVYKDLQVLYRKYGYPLTLESLQRADFGMHLPCSFYDNESDSHDDTDMNHRFLIAETPIEDIIEVFLEPRYTLMHRIERHAEYYSESLDEKERVKFNTWFAYRHKSLMDYYYKMGGVLEHSSYDYYTQPMWDYIDLYMNKERDWDREFCVKWNIGESLSHLKKLDSLRPLIDSIIEKTRDECFAFGVKVRNTEVVWSNQPNAR